MFLEKNYKMPVSTNYMKFVEGKNKFRVLSDAITGWEYWTTDNKPVRQEEPFEDKPENIKIEKDGNFRVNHFWAFVVWNYEAKKVQILQLTQKSIMQAIKAYLDEPDWGDPKGYDIVVTRTGSGFDTEYQTIANPHSKTPEEAEKAYKNAKIKLEALYLSEDPFKTK